MNRLHVWILHSILGGSLRAMSRWILFAFSFLLLAGMILYPSGMALFVGLLTGWMLQPSRGSIRPGEDVVRTVRS